MPRFCLLWILLASLTPSTLSAQSGASPRVYSPWLQEAILERAQSIVIAKFARATTLPNREMLLRFSVKKVLRGEAVSTVLIYGAEKAILANRGLDKLIFLRRSRRGALDVAIDFVDLPRDDRVNRIVFLESFLKATRKEKGSLAEGIKTLCLAHIASKSSWVRRIVVRELEVLSRYSAGMFGAHDLTRVEKLEVRDLGRTERRLWRECVQRIEENRALGWTRSRLNFPTAQARQAYLADMALFDQSKDPARRLGFMKDTVETFGRSAAPFFARLLDDPMIQVRRQAVYYLGEMESAAGMGRLIEMLRGNGAVDLRREVARALGKIASARALPALQAALGDVLLEKDVLWALAVLDTQESVQLIRDLDQKLRRDPSSDPKRRRWVSRLLSPSFLKEIREERKARRRRWRRRS